MSSTRMTYKMEKHEDDVIKSFSLSYHGFDRGISAIKKKPLKSLAAFVKLNNFRIRSERRRKLRELSHRFFCRFHV